MIGKSVELYKDVYAYGPFDLIVELGSSLGRLLPTKILSKIYLTYLSVIDTSKTCFHRLKT